ncbi:MAG: AraC family transcriptional regulator [Planctomycetota bacterium]|nr:AraC family transcriptional regulator [Planctomycetota bacterium]
MRHAQPHIAFGRKAQPPRYRFTTRNYEHFQVIFVRTGVLHYADARGAAALGPGCVALLREGSVFDLWTEVDGYQGVYFAVIGDPNPHLRGESYALKAPAEARTLAGCMEREIAAPGPEAQALLGHLGWAMAWLALRMADSRSAPRAAADPSRAWAESVRQALDATVYTGQHPREVLAGMSLSYRQLARHFKKARKISPKCYQMQARVEEARRLLRFTRRSVTEIAYELGFSSSQHFATQFRSVTGMPPQAYRRRLA